MSKGESLVKYWQYFILSKVVKYFRNIPLDGPQLRWMEIDEAACLTTVEVERTRSSCVGVKTHMFVWFCCCCIIEAFIDGCLRLFNPTSHGVSDSVAPIEEQNINVKG